MPLTEGELILQIKQNNCDAFTQLYCKYKSQLFRLAVYLTDSVQAAEDLFQETWLRVVKNLAQSQNIQNVKAWIYTVMMNIHRDELRKKKIRRLFLSKRQVVDDLILQYDYTVIPADKPKDNLIGINTALQKAIAELPLKQRRVFILKEIEGFKHHEISQILGIKTGTSKSLLYRAIQFLQHELAEYRENI